MKSSLIVIAIVLVTPLSVAKAECTGLCQQVNTRIGLNSEDSAFALACRRPALASEVDAVTFAYLARKLNADDYQAFSDRYMEMVKFKVEFQGTWRPEKKQCVELVKGIRNNIQRTKDLSRE